MGAALFSSVYLTIPVSTSDTTTYSTVQMASDPRMPMGMSRWGPGLLGGGGDHVEADEGEEHDRRPEADAEPAVGQRLDAEQDLDERRAGLHRVGRLGRLGRRRDERAPVGAVILTAPAPMNRNTTASLMATMTALKRELSFTPRIITAVSSSTIAPAARLTEPRRRSTRGWGTPRRSTGPSRRPPPPTRGRTRAPGPSR